MRVFVRSYRMPIRIRIQVKDTQLHNQLFFFWTFYFPTSVDLWQLWLCNLDGFYLDLFVCRPIRINSTINYLFKTLICPCAMREVKLSFKLQVLFILVVSCENRYVPNKTTSVIQARQSTRLLPWVSHLILKMLWSSFIRKIFVNCRVIMSSIFVLRIK